jgi:hypothetical protein
MQQRTKGVAGLLLAAMLATTGASRADEPPPSEDVVLLHEIPNIATRRLLGSLPQDLEDVTDALSTAPEALDDIVAMHLGRLHPTPHELTPGVAPLVSLVDARADLLLDPDHRTKKVEDTLHGEVAVLLLPVDAVTAAVVLPTQVVRSDPQATPLPERPVDLRGVTYEVNGVTRTVDRYLADGATNAIAFMHDGELVYDAYQNGFTADTRHQLWSATKSVTTALVGIAVSEGRVGISSRWSPASTGSTCRCTSPRSWC